MKALITGITGQDGSYLAELLLSKGYEVHGTRRRSSSLNTSRIDHIKNKDFYLHYGDLTDSSNLIKLIKEIQPKEIYNLGAMSHVRISFDMPEYTANVDALGTLRILEAIKFINPKIKLYQASTSELFGKVQEVPQSEKTPFYPRSPYGVAKLYSYWAVKNYREAYNIFAVNGILFNHESPRRGENFVTQKIIREALAIIKGRDEPMKLGNIYAQRDWGHAKDYVEAMWLMLQNDTPKDYVVSTGKMISVKEFLILVFKHLDIAIEFTGKGLQEKAIIKSYPTHLKNKLNKGKIIMVIDEYYFRPCEVDLLIGDSSMIQKDLGWQPNRNIEELIKDMINNFENYGEDFV